MTTIELTNCNLTEIINEDLQKISGGFISYLSITGFVGKVAKFVAGEILDFAEGFSDGYSASN